MHKLQVFGGKSPWLFLILLCSHREPCGCLDKARYCELGKISPWGFLVKVIW
jgi:hypothetical protein